jgi:hypothetical protein
MVVDIARKTFIGVAGVTAGEALCEAVEACVVLKKVPVGTVGTVGVVTLSARWEFQVAQGTDSDVEKITGLTSIALHRGASA